MGTPRTRPHPLAECTDCTCFAIRRAARAVTQLYDRTLRPSGLRGTQFTVLTMLALSGPTPLKQVADRLGMERTTLTRNLQPLLAGGLVVVAGSDDRRVRALSITAKGERAARAALPLWRAAQRAVKDQLTGSFLAALSTAARALPALRAQAEPARSSRKYSSRKE